MTVNYSHLLLLETGTALNSHLYLPYYFQGQVLFGAPDTFAERMSKFQMVEITGAETKDMEDRLIRWLV